MAMEAFGRDLYVRHTDVNGKSTVQHHRVWDVGLFMDAHEQECRRTNDKDDPVNRRARVEQVLGTEYEAQRSAGRRS